MSGISRRRFLSGLAAGVGLGAAGAAIWSFRPEGTPQASPPTTEATGPPSVTTTTTQLTTTTVPATSTTAAATTTQTPVDPVVVIPVICRDAWGALAAVGEYAFHQIEHITIHHTAVLLETNADAPARARQHQAYHQERGWPDLAYHFLIDAAGNVYEGRPVDAVGDTGTEYDPTGHFLICCEGNFDEQPLPTAQYARLTQLASWGCAQFGIEPEAIRGHRDVASTSCPGDDLYTHIADGTLSAAIDLSTAYRLEITCGGQADALVAAIEAGL